MQHPAVIHGCVRSIPNIPAKYFPLKENDSCLLVGAQKEVDLWPVFLELLRLLPRTRVRVVLAGPDVPDHLDGAQCSFPAVAFATALPVDGGRVSTAASAEPPSVQAGTGSSLFAAAPEAPAGRAGAASLTSQDSVADGSLVLSFRRGLGHDLLPALTAKLGGVDLVFGPNAGELTVRSSLSCCLDAQH